VDGEDIAKIVSKWTGIPVSRMMEARDQRSCCRMEENLRKRVVGREGRGPVRWFANAVKEKPRRG